MGVLDLPQYGDGQPPSTVIGVTRLSNPDFLVEIDLVAVVDDAGAPYRVASATTC
jgi:enamine deaminase RidA (YjgF/YER057c/UK114 family)